MNLPPLHPPQVDPDLKAQEDQATHLKNVRAMPTCQCLLRPSRKRRRKKRAIHEERKI